MTIQQKLVPAGLKNNPNCNMRSIGHVTIHTTGNRNAGATAKMHADYQYNGSSGSQTSWHYTVDSKEIWQSLEDARACWHAGDGSGDGNYTSIGIEICVNDKASFAQACANAAWLAATLLKRHGLTVDKVVQHNHWSGKDCPKELRSGEWGVTWDKFVADVKQCLAMLNTDPVPAVQEPSAWAAEAWAWGIAQGVTDGTRPLDAITREQVVQMLYNMEHAKR